MIGGELAAQRQQHNTDQSHIVIEGEPGNDTIVTRDLQTLHRDVAQIGQHRLLRDLATAWETGASRRVLKVGWFVRLQRFEFDAGRFQLIEFIRGPGLDQIQTLGRLPQKAHVRIGCHCDTSAACIEHAFELLDVGLARTELKTGRQSYWNQAGILTGEKETMEHRFRFRHDCHAAAALAPQPPQPLCELLRLRT